MSTMTQKWMNKKDADNLNLIDVDKASFPYDRPHRPSRLKKCSDDRDDHMETLSRRSQTTRTTETTSIAWIELSSIRTMGTIL